MDYIDLTKIWRYLWGITEIEEGITRNYIW